MINEETARQSAALRVVVENRQEWFWMLMNYLQMKTFALWLNYYPTTSFESFLLIWPTLLDSMLDQAASAATKALAEKSMINPN